MRADRETVAGGVQRDRPAEIVAGAQRRHVDILAGRIAGADRRFQKAAGKVRIRKAEEIDRARVVVPVALAVVAPRPDGETIPGGVQRDRPAEKVVRPERGDVDILAAHIAVADHGFEHAAGKSGVGETEEINGAGVRRRIGEPVVALRPDGEPVPEGVQRNARAEPVAIVQRSHIDIGLADIPCADDPLKDAAGKRRIGKAGQIDPARGADAVVEAVVAPRPDGEAVAGGVQ